MVLPVNKRVVVDAFAVVVRAQIALHHEGILSGFIWARAFVRIHPESRRRRAGSSLFLPQYHLMQQGGILRILPRTCAVARPCH